MQLPFKQLFSSAGVFFDIRDIPLLVYAQLGDWGLGVLVLTVAYLCFWEVVLYSDHMVRQLLMTNLLGLRLHVVLVREHTGGVELVQVGHGVASRNGVQFVQYAGHL